MDFLWSINTYANTSLKKNQKGKRASLHSDAKALPIAQ
jgi:hypothetical protein